MRTNIYKKKIVRVLEDNHLLSISDIHTKIPDANYSTVYRNIEQLLEEQVIRKIVLDKGNTMYELDSQNNHDHFLCTDCGDIKEIHVPVIQSLPRAHTVSDLLVRGLCGECNTNI